MSGREPETDPGAPGRSKPDFTGRRPAVPDHELLRCIGRGSYGEVWMARSVLGMRRAVKVVYRDRFNDARPYEREFTGILRIEPLSRASDGLVDILHVGRHEPEGYFYYVMELADDANDHDPDCDGGSAVEAYQPRSLARELKRRGPLSFEECIHLGLNLSSALSHLHQNGLIHRDVKPSNILYVGGTPKLGDIGLVGETGESLTYVGTEGYIPPEGPGSPQADVFSLGKVLYEAGTGQDRLAFPHLPDLSPDDDARAKLAELNEVFLKACAPDIRHRYGTAEDLHADLALLHRGQSVRRQRKVARRWRRASMAGYAGAMLAGLILGIVWSPRQRPATETSTRRTPAPSELAKPTPIDLTRFYNVSLGSNWMGDFPGNDLASLPTGWHRFGPAWFDVRGAIQLGGSYSDTRRRFFPAAVDGIPVNRACERLRFFHGTVWQTEPGRHVGSYVIHFADGRREELPLRYAEEVRNWWWNPKGPMAIQQGQVAWLGTNAATLDQNRVCLYSITWHNPFPDVPITSLDFISTRSPSCPFLIAVTAE